MFSPRTAKLAERVSVAIMAIGIAMVWQPWLHILFRLGFPVILVGIVLFMIASHIVVEESGGGDGEHPHPH